MAKVIWTTQAWEELAEINDALTRYSEKYADFTLDRILNLVNKLEEFPQIGKVVPELNFQMIRELIIEKYRIVYFVSNNAEVQILTIRHFSRPLPSSILSN